MSDSQQKTDWPKELLADMIAGRLGPDATRMIQSRPKDDDRFEKMLDIEQARVQWKERILVPLQEHLYVVHKGEERIVKCECGHEFGDYRRNWKLSALVYERDPTDDAVHIGPRAADPGWMILREFYCPGCWSQLEVEAVPPGHPIIFQALPDIDGFYAKRPELLRRVLEQRD